MKQTIDQWVIITILSNHNDLILAMDRGEVTSLIRLDLSAAFDTGESFHPSSSSSTLAFGLHDTSVDWF